MIETEETEAAAEANHHLIDLEMIEAVSEEEMIGLEMIAIKNLQDQVAAAGLQKKIIHYNQI